MTTNTNPTDIREAIDQANRISTATFKGRNAAEIAALYTDDAMLLPPNSDIVSGKEAIQDFWQGALDMGVEEIELETVDVDGQIDTAIEVGKFVLIGANGECLDKGKYLVTWKLVNGQWKLHWDMYNSSMPIEKNDG